MIDLFGFISFSRRRHFMTTDIIYNASFNLDLGLYIRIILVHSIADDGPHHSIEFQINPTGDNGPIESIDNSTTMTLSMNQSIIKRNQMINHQQQQHDNWSRPRFLYSLTDWVTSQEKWVREPTERDDDDLIRRPETKYVRL